MTIRKAKFLTSQSVYTGAVGGDLPEIAMAGKSNVGKSSLINSLTRNSKLARTSSEPGKTRLINYYEINEEFLLTDLPGYGFAKRAPEDIRRWSSLTDGYFTEDYSKDRIKCVIQLIDIKVGITSDDEMMIGYMNDAGIPYVIAATKCDKLSKTEADKQIDSIISHPVIAEGTAVLGFSSLKGTGRDELWSLIYKFI